MMRRLFSTILLLVLAMSLLAGAGCAKRHKISIVSDTAWLGVIDHQSTSSIADSGNATFRVAGEIHCITVSNRRNTGFVRVRIDEGAWVETTDPLGTVETCR